MTKELPGLTDARGLAIVLVLAAHLGGELTGATASTVLANSGVILFFLLSGVLMDRALSENSHIFNYACRRAARIMPMYWVSVALVAIAGGKHDLLQVASNLTFTAPIFSQERMLGVYWTLYIEVLFYVIAPVVFARNLSAPAIVLISAASVVAQWSIGTAGSGAYFYISYCLLGSQIGAYMRGQMWFGWTLLSLAVIAISSSIIFGIGAWMAIVSVICFITIIAATIFQHRVKILSFFGTISYSLYLIHSLVAEWFASNSIQSNVAILLASIFISLLCSYAVEKPVINAAKKMLIGYNIPKHQHI